MFLLFCLVANGLSIFAPIHLPAGSLKPANPKFVPILLQILTIFCIFPLTQAPTLLPLGIEVALEYLEWGAGLPICLLLTIAQCAAVILLYRLALNWQGRLLQEREQQILETVTSRGA
ncbi:MAG TPA: hypothetical protein VL475_14765, partial [Planctomycetaceae bacterium]|nr:hypothetical protein [Planctomycetaceae bacterium]